jgi:hypothetical protein
MNAQAIEKEGDTVLRLIVHDSGHFDLISTTEYV